MLNGWHNEDPNDVPGHPDDGEAALAALKKSPGPRGAQQTRTLYRWAILGSNQ
jgi:hypothetical protein